MVRLKSDKRNPPPFCARFQFHYGSIKICICKIRNISYRCFNSTMVRLKYFQVPDIVCYNAFQFHYGSIKINTVLTRRKVIWCFNSTMVRLKSGSGHSSWSLGFEFQFHYGSIKMQRNTHCADYSLCFNSTMVRLKYYVTTATNSHKTFQFHYGSIKMLGLNSL